ncbi:Multidrug resistance efflux pump [Maridesulfovibrio ferrireducens]|uniref:Multidrug resistance efflux pump n=1 Tax=Maridesulfovibrio ferrireducens TaxID=246191 RepID=A0A1G9CW23_9BACT|nr:HlyD family secretion protein [Maridesulfovibrio ferrireducens]SDK55878.1 Multidrug resistance efflux pump [Maridesulfovibrio ferrireducens]
MKVFFSKKTTTWIVLLVIALLPLPSIANYMQRFVVRNGVVTAYRYEVRAPIDGVVNNITVTPGMSSAGKTILTLGNRRATGQYETLEKELLSLGKQLEDNKNKLSKYINRLERDINQSLAILKARLTGEEASKVESIHRRNRINKLVVASVATQEDADQVESKFQKADSQVRTTLLEIEQLKHRRNMVNQGMLPNDLSDGALQVQRRINELHQNILACKRRMSESETDFTTGTTYQQKPETDRNNRFARASVKLPDTAVVWEVDVQNGMEVAKGDRLLSYIDRSRLMVEVAIDDATLELIEPGQAVKVRLFGRSDFIEGKVIRVMGSAGLWHTSLFAADIKSRSSRDGRVLVLIKDENLYNHVGKFCGVGRTAYAEFEGIGLMEQYFGVFLR